MALRIGMFPRPQRMTSPGGGTRLASLIMENIQAGKQRAYEREQAEHARELQETLAHLEESGKNRRNFFDNLAQKGSAAALAKANLLIENGNIEEGEKHLNIARKLKEHEIKMKEQEAKAESIGKTTGKTEAASPYTIGEGEDARKVTLTESQRDKYREKYPSLRLGEPVGGRGDVYNIGGKDTADIIRQQRQEIRDQMTWFARALNTEGMTPPSMDDMVSSLQSLVDDFNVVRERVGIPPLEVARPEDTEKGFFERIFISGGPKLPSVGVKKRRASGDKKTKTKTSPSGPSLDELGEKNYLDTMIK